MAMTDNVKADTERVYLDAGMTKRDLIMALEDLRFPGRGEAFQRIALDRPVRDFLLTALRPK